MTVAALSALAALMLVGPATAVGYSVGPISEVSAGCPGTGDVQAATDPVRRYVYIAFEGCEHDRGVGFVSSPDGGASYSQPVALPGSRGGWDPSVAVAPDGTLYVAFMDRAAHREYPTVDVSHDQGRTFSVEKTLQPQQSGNWGDAEYIAVAPDGTLYVAWAYGPSRSKVRERCAAHGSCFSVSGDLNVVVQSSTDEGASFGPMSVVSPGYPDAGADEGAIAVQGDGQVDVLYQGYEVTDPKTLKLANGHEYFASSLDHGRSWSAPVAVGASAGQSTIDEWWNDGSIAAAPGGDLFASWDTQAGEGAQSTDTGWLSFSTDGGREWSAPVQAPADQTGVPHIMEVTGASPGEAYVGWLSDSSPAGYAQYLRTFSVAANDGGGGWLTAPEQISSQFGDPDVAPGDTFGIVTLSPGELVLSWGSAVPGSHRRASVFAAPVATAAGELAPLGRAATRASAGRPAARGTPALAGKTVGIDPGHNGRNYSDPAYIDHLVWNGREEEPCDTTGTETDTGYTEARFNFNVAEDLAGDLRAEGARVVLTRPSNDGVGPCVPERSEILNRAHANVAIDIHADGGPPGGRGFTILEPVADGPNDRVIGASKAFGRLVLERFHALTGMPVSDYDGTGGISLRDNLAGLNLTSVPKVLIECGNMRNPTDAALLVRPSFQRLAAQALAAAITAYLAPR